MSLLTICQNAADVVGLERPSGVIGSNLETAKRLLAAARTEGRVLSKKPWTILKAEHTFSTVASTSSYSMPSDFAFFLDMTGWNRTAQWPLIGPLTNQEWQLYKSGITNVGIRDRFMLRASSAVNKFYIDPTPTSAETVAFEYVTNQWCEDSGGTGQSDWAADTDVARISEELIELGVIWRIQKVMGIDYGEEYNEYMNEVRLAFARDGGAPALSFINRPMPDVNLPDTGFGS